MSSRALASLLLISNLALASGELPGGGTVSASSTAGRFTILQVTDALADPLGVAHAGDGSGRIFVVQRGGAIRIVKNRQLQPAPFLDISTRIACCGERGLLGLAFHPAYETNGEFFVFYTRASDGDLVVARYSVSVNEPDVADPASEEILLVIEHSSQSNHNGGQLAFGPDGYLYIATGDGGGGGDPGENAQNLESLLGKLLRIDVDSASPYAIPPTNPFVGIPGRDEVWAYGLRNPWRFSFDRVTGDLLIGDVGQGQWEEVNHQPASSAGGENYGWDVLEGAHCYEDVPTGSCAAYLNGGSVLPVVEYSHSFGCSITGGYVYRGGPPSFFSGNYLYGDYCSGRIWRASGGGAGWSTTLLIDTAFNISSFGEDERGDLYFVDLGGTLQWIAPYTFTDVLPLHWAWRFIETIAAAGVTEGCTLETFCPGEIVRRDQMAIFLLRGMHGAAYEPPPATGTMFSDVPATAFGAAWIEQLATEGITAGCGGGRYCPAAGVTRAQMAVFLLKSVEGPAYVPPPCSGLFDDVPCSGPYASFAPWIEEVRARGITAGCTPTTYCPASIVSRAEMAVFITRAFQLAF